MKGTRAVRVSGRIRAWLRRAYRRETDSSAISRYRKDPIRGLRSRRTGDPPRRRAIQRRLPSLVLLSNRSRASCIHRGTRARSTSCLPASTYDAVSLLRARTRARARARAVNLSLCIYRCICVCISVYWCRRGRRHVRTRIYVIIICKLFVR